MSTLAPTTTESYRTCSASFNVSLAFTPPPFVVNVATSRMHTRSPRFGHSNNINLLIQGKNSQQQDYLTGLLAASFFMFCLFLVWMLILLVLKCLGPNRVGFFSGRRQPPVKPTKPEAVQRQEHLRMKQPFQHNGVASGYGDDATSHRLSPTRGAKKILKPVAGVAKAPITVVSKARQRKRELERRQHFSRMKSSNSMDKEDAEDVEKGEESMGDSGALSTVAEESATNKSQQLTEADRKIIREYEQEWKVYSQQIYRQQDRIRRIRVGAGVCAMGITIAALVFTIMSEPLITTSLDKFQQGLELVDRRVDEAMGAANRFTTQRNAIIQEKVRKFYVEMNGTWLTR